MDITREKGFCLKTIPFKDNSIITTFLTEYHGIRSFFVGKKNFAFCSLFSLLEFVYKPSKNNIYKIKELSILNNNFSIRQNLISLQVAGKLTKAILISQLPEKKSHEIFILYNYFLNKIPLLSDPWLLCSSFYLRLLKLEGLLNLNKLPEHSNLKNNKKSLDILTNSKNFKDFEKVKEKNLFFKVEKLFEILINY